MGKLYIISGDDDFARKRKAKARVLKLSGLPMDADVDANPDLEIISGDADDVKPPVILARFLESLRTPPFLSDGKLLWLRHFPDLDIFNETSDIVVSTCEELFRELPPEINVVIDGPGLDQRKSFARNLKNAKAEIEICGVSGKNTDRANLENRRNIISAFCRQEGRRIDPEAMQFLLEAVGGDTGTLVNELKKLCCFIGNAPVITLEKCQQIISRSSETLAWEYVSAVVEKDCGRALLLLAKQISNDNDAIRILMSLAGEFQRMAQIRAALKSLDISRVNPSTFDMLPDSVREQNKDNMLLKMHPYRAFKVSEAALRCKPQEVAASLAKIRECSRLLVSTSDNARMLLERLTLQLTGR